MHLFLIDAPQGRARGQGTTKAPFPTPSVLCSRRQDLARGGGGGWMWALHRMGVSIYFSPSCTLAHAHPGALNAVWQLKFGAPLQSFWATTSRRTTSVFLSALSNTLPFVHSWGSSLLSVTAWMQLAFLSGYPTLAVHASAITALHRCLPKRTGTSPCLCSGSCASPPACHRCSTTRSVTF